MINAQIDCRCPICNAISTVEMPVADLRRWQAGEAIQRVAPYLSATKREILISGLCPACQDELFNTEEYE